MANREATFSTDTENNKIIVVRTFNAPLQQVWEAWTTAELLDQWWAPKPYKAETKTMDFREGGYWQYAMKGPQGDVSWCRESFKTIEEKKSITNAVSFCDEDGHVNTDFPTMYWNKQFSENGGETSVTLEITFDSAEALETIVKMGFKEGFAMGLDNLDELLAAK